MKAKEMDILEKHFDYCFEQTDYLVLHPTIDNGVHLDILLYKPNEKYPFWKLVTMGASDYKMPKIPTTFGLRNEYIMFVDKEVNLEDKEVLGWYYNILRMVALYAHDRKTHITYAHSIEWENENADEEMVAAFIELPQVIENTNVLRCPMGLFKTVVCLQVVLLNKDDLNKLIEIGPQLFSEYLYPENGDKPHYLSERHRSEKF